MSEAGRIRGLCGGHWFRVAAVGVTAAVVVAALLAIFGAAAPLTALQHSVIHSLTMAALAGAALPPLVRRLHDVPVAIRWGAILAVLAILPVLGSLLACSAISVLPFEARKALSACFGTSFRINALLTVTLGVAMTLYESQRARLAEATLELRTRELEHERARKAALEARLASLESRLRPHFLFNTLNAIAALIHEDPDRADRTVERLAALLRFSLDATERGIVPLADELRIVTDYLEIEKTRLGTRLGYAIDVDPDVADRPIPPLAIQTLVENSVKHAIAPRPGGGRVRVTASAAGDALVLTVWDDGPGFTPAEVRSGHGLDNLQGRLAGRYGSAATLDVTRRDGGTLVTVSLPAGGNHGTRPT